MKTKRSKAKTQMPKDIFNSSFYDDETFNAKLNAKLKNLCSKIDDATSDLHSFMMESKVSPQQAAIIRDKIDIVRAANRVLMLSKVDFNK